MWQVIIFSTTGIPKSFCILFCSELPYRTHEWRTSLSWDLKWSLRVHLQKFCCTEPADNGNVFSKWNQSSEFWVGWVGLLMLGDIDNKALGCRSQQQEVTPFPHQHRFCSFKVNHLERVQILIWADYVIVEVKKTKQIRVVTCSIVLYEISAPWWV